MEEQQKRKSPEGCGFYESLHRRSQRIQRCGCRLLKARFRVDINYPRSLKGDPISSVHQYVSSKIVFLMCYLEAYITLYKRLIDCINIRG